MRFRSLFAAAACLALAAAAHAQREKLKPGDEAPGFDVEKWVAGEETSIEAERIYVVEFWEAGCKQCLKSMQVLGEIQETYRHHGLVVVAVTSEDAASASSWVRRGINYAVAIDRRDGTNRAWVRKAGLEKLPVTFIVDKKGRIQYIGRTSDTDFPIVLKLVVAGRYDAKLFTETRPMIDAAVNARKQRNWRLAAKLYDDIVARDKHVFALFTLAKFEMLIGRNDMNEPETAYEWARSILATHADDPNLLAEMAEKIVTDPNIPDENRNYDLALQAAELAASGFAATEPGRYAIQAIVHFHAGRFDEAIKLQKKAYFLARPFEKEHHDRQLRRYKEAGREAAAKVE